MELPEGLDSLFVVVLVAAIVPLIVSAVPGRRVPEVVLLLVFGVVVGPDVLDLAQTELGDPADRQRRARVPLLRRGFRARPLGAAGR